MIVTPELQRMAIHQAGHAVVQALLGRTTRDHCQQPAPAYERNPR